MNPKRIREALVPARLNCRRPELGKYKSLRKDDFGRMIFFLAWYRLDHPDFFCFIRGRIFLLVPVGGWPPPGR